MTVVDALPRPVGIPRVELEHITPGARPLSSFVRSNVYEMVQSIAHLARVVWAEKDQPLLRSDAPTATENLANRGGFPELVCTLHTGSVVAPSRPKS